MALKLLSFMTQTHMPPRLSGSGEDHHSEEEIARIWDDAIRRALNTPPKPLKGFIGKDKRAIAQRESPVTKEVVGVFGPSEAQGEIHGAFLPEIKRVIKVKGAETGGVSV